VFTLNVPASFCRNFWCQWNETVIHDFLGTPDGESPYYVDPVFDPAGNLYGTRAARMAEGPSSNSPTPAANGQKTFSITSLAATVSTQRAA